MSPEQMRLARVALGLPNGGGQSNGNLAYAEGATSDADEWDGMRAQGFAACEGVTASGAYYCLTRAGADRALLPGERLNLSHFPPIGAH